ncbi:MAG: response regulator [Pseudomonadota bacterium]
MDDSSVDRRRIKRLAAGSAYDIDFTETGTIAETLAVIADRAADFAICDYRMPDGDGITLASELSSDRAAQIPVVVITGEGDQRTAIRALREGAIDFLDKDDITLEAFDRAVATALARPSLRLEKAGRARAEAELSHVRRTAVSNMRALKAETEALAEAAWTVLSGGEIEVAQAAARLAGARQAVDRLIDETVIDATTGSSETEVEVDLTSFIQGLATDPEGPAQRFQARIEVGPLPTMLVNPAQIALLFETLWLGSVAAAAGEPAQLTVSWEAAEMPTLRIADRGSSLAQRLRRAENMSLSPTRDPAQADLSHSLGARLMARHGGELLAQDAPEGGCWVDLIFPRSRVVSVPEGLS